MINQATINLVKEYEGLRLVAYQDTSLIWTIGYGTTAAAGLGIIPRKGMTITQEQAEYYLHLGLEKFALIIRPMIKVRVTDNEFGACLSLAYNIGPGRFARSSVLRFLNLDNRPVAATKFALWNKDEGKVLAGLTRRRAAEAALFKAT